MSVENIFIGKEKKNMYSISYDFLLTRKKSLFLLLIYLMTLDTNRLRYVLSL